MFCSISTRSAIALAVLVSLSACGSGSDDPVAQTPDPQDTTDNSGEADPVIPNETTDPTPPVDTTDPVALFGLPEFITSECGSLTIASTATTNSLDAPARLLIGEPVRGQLVPNSQRDDFHVWQIDLEPGNYHFVADASVISEANASIGLDVTSLGESTADNERLAFDVISGLDLRVREYMEIREAQTLTFTVESPYDQIHNYTLAIFRNGSAVPSPAFERCLPVTTLSLDSTQSVTLPGKDTREDELWYSIDLQSGAYKLDASTSSVENASLGYTFSSFDRFGEEESIDRLAFDVVSGNRVTTSDTFERDRDGLVWIRVSNPYSGASRTLVFTITKL